MCMVRVKPGKLETVLRAISAMISYTLLLRIEAIGFPTFWAATVACACANPGAECPSIYPLIKGFYLTEPYIILGVLLL